MSSRKRRAPGASPITQQSTYQDAGNISADQYMNNWTDPSSVMGDMNTFADPSFFDGMAYTGNVGGTPSMHNRVTSLDGINGNVDIGAGQLVRRNPNQQLATRGQTPWGDTYNSQQPGWGEQEDDDEELERKAEVAKKEAQSKRKQIPPFVQKLSSFLDNGNNTNLIRWSDDGNSFIVLDEDEFARTLIPELFKHNNYASFVRQLNMYGFHKKVGLSDNSMKASETKAKAPSEYYNKYFKRSRPELLWLIQKPKNASGGPKRKRDDDAKQGDSDEDRKYVPDGGGGGYPEDLTVRGNQEMAMIPRTEYNSLRAEVRALQQQQKVISGVLTQLKRQNEQMYQQATAFQTLHDRHENSINAILTFLATFYNRSLEGNNNGVNIADMFASAMPPQQPHGNVVDVGDFPQKTPSSQMQLQRTKRPLALLPAPAQKDPPSTRAATLSPSVRSPTSPLPKTATRQSVFKSPVPHTRAPAGYASHPGRDGTPAAPLKVDTASPSKNATSSLPEHDEVMSAIHNVNASTSQYNQAQQVDLPAALNDYQTQGGHTPLTPQQRNDMLSLMANNAFGASNNSGLASNQNNAVVNPQPPPMPNLSQYTETQAQLDLLQKMSEEQNSRVQHLQERLQPLSPSGQIPGLNDSSYFDGAPLGDPGSYDLDIDSFVQDNDYFAPNSTTQPANANPDLTTLPDLPYTSSDVVNMGATGLDGVSGDPFNFDSTNDHLQAGDGDNRVESVSSSAASPAPTVQEVEDETRVRRSPKRRKK